ncbi:hypothetical protein ACQEU3_38275 [Spirillospora sp. CA-253888]
MTTPITRYRDCFMTALEAIREAVSDVLRTGPAAGPEALGDGS